MNKKGVVCGDEEIEGPIGSAATVVQTSGLRPAVLDIAEGRLELYVVARDVDDD